MSNHSTNSKYSRDIYIARINRVMDYIEEHIGEELSLIALANVAFFSPYYFHRIFRAMVGETLNSFIQRRRVERAASKLLITPEAPITKIALELGFSGSAVFARSFKQAYKMSASEWRNQKLKNSKICKTSGKIGKENNDSSFYFDIIQNKFIWKIEMENKILTNIEVKELPEMHFAYLRHIGPYKGDEKLFARLFEKLFKWAGPRNLIKFPETKMISVYYDDPEITDESKLRVDACITIPPETKVDGEIGKSILPAGKYAIGHFELPTYEYEAAWKAMCGAWLPQSGYQPCDTPCFELSLNDPKEHPEKKCIVDICIPVKPLQITITIPNTNKNCWGQIQLSLKIFRPGFS
jgi:AraC family transcriptional regulator